MMAAPLMITVLAILLLVVASTPTARLETVSLETGYSVTTVLDGNKLPTPIHPYSIVPRPNGEPTLLLLDSADSAFYSFSPLSQDGGMVKLAGSGVSGYADGGREVAMFARPKSFTVDAKANVYVADRSNHVLRKITPSGITTTISGGFSQKTGNMDGPAQNATFSDDFEVVFIPKMCALLISDRGNSLVRRMDLKQEDCVYESQKGGLGTTSVSIIAVLCALFGSVVGFVARPFLVSHEIYSSHRLIKTWKHYQTNLKLSLPTLFSVIRSAVANAASFYLLAYKTACLIFSFCFEMFITPRSKKQVPFMEPVSLLDNDPVNNNARDSVTNNASGTLPYFTEQLADMISFDADLGVREPHSSEEIGMGNELKENNTMKIDTMMTSNLSDFVELARRQGESEGTLSSSSGLVKRHTGTYGL